MSSFQGTDGFFHQYALHRLHLSLDGILIAKTLFGIRVKVLQRQQVSTMMDIMFRFRIHLEVIQMLRVQ